MSNLDLIKQMYVTFNETGDVNSVLDLFDPQVVRGASATRRQDALAALESELPSD